MKSFRRQAGVESRAQMEEMAVIDIGVLHPCN